MKIYLLYKNEFKVHGDLHYIDDECCDKPIGIFVKSCEAEKYAEENFGDKLQFYSNNNDMTKISNENYTIEEFDLSENRFNIIQLIIDVGKEASILGIDKNYAYELIANGYDLHISEKIANGVDYENLRIK